MHVTHIFIDGVRPHTEHLTHRLIGRVPRQQGLDDTHFSIDQLREAWLILARPQSFSR